MTVKGNRLKKLVGLQVARGVAALLVVLAHSIAHPYPNAQGISHVMGRGGVTLFFVVSGFIMTHVTGQGSFDPLKFIWRRLLRVVPPYYIATALAAIGAFFVPWAFKDTPFDISHIVYSLLFIPVFEPGSSTDISPFFKLGWTLNFEIFFYLLFATCFMMTAYARGLALTVLFIALVAFGMLHPQTGAIGIFYTRADTLAFAAGIWLAIATSREAPRQYLIQAISALMLGIGSFVIIAANYAVLREHFVTQLWVMFACVAILWAMVELEEKIAASVPRWLVFSGDASYSIYLFHMFGIGATYKLGSALLPHEYMGIFLPVAFIGGTVAGIAAYLFIEKPLLGYISTRNWSFRQAKA